MERYATFTKSFDEAMRDYMVFSKDMELIAIIGHQQYVVKISDNKCKYYKVLNPRKI